MSLDSTGGIHKHQQVQPSEQAQEAEEISKVKQQIENEKLMKSSIGKAEEEKILHHLEPSNPQLKPPNLELLSQKTDAANLQKEELADQRIIDELSKYPEFEKLLSEQKFISRDAIVDHARQIILKNSVEDMTLGALAGKALSEKIREAASIEKNPALEEVYGNLQLKLLTQNHPSSKILIESLKADLIAQGKSPREAESLAEQKALDMIREKFSGDITTANPKIDKAVATLLAAQLGGIEAAKDFVAGLTDLVGMEQNLINLFAGIQQVQQTPGTDAAQKAMAVHQNVIDGARQIIDEAMEALSKVPLPENQRTAILDFMQKLSEALALLDRVMAELNISEAQRSKAEFGAKVDAILTQLKSQLDQLKKAMKEIKKAKKKAKKFGVLGKILKILNKVMAAVMMVGIILMIALLLFMMPVMAPIAIIGIIGLVALFVGVVVSLALSETGELDKMMEGFFEFFYMILTEVLGLDVSRETAGLIMVGVVGAVAVLPILLSVLLLPLLLVLAPLILVLAPLLLGPLLLAFGVILLIAMMASLVLAPIVIQFLPEMILRSGLLAKLASKIGKSMGMSEGQINDLETYLRGATAMMTIATGMSVSSSFGKISRDEQELVSSETKKRGQMYSAESKQGRVAAYRNIGQVKTLNDLAAMNAAGPEELEEKQEELQEMIALLAKIITQMKKLLAALMAGGDPSAIEGAVKEIQSIIDNEMSGFITSSGEEIDLMPFIAPLVDSTLHGIPNVLPSPEAIKQMLQEARSREIFIEDEEDLIRTQELMG